MEWDRTIAELSTFAAEIGFEMSLMDGVGLMLGGLLASKPDGRFLELGTGAGVGTAYLLRGATAGSSVTSVEIDPDLLDAAAGHLPDDRMTWVCADAGEWLSQDDSARST